MNLSAHSLLGATARFAVGVIAFAILPTASAQTPNNIGIFDLKAIHAAPLDPEVLSKTKLGDVTIEQVRYTSLPGVRVVATLTYKDGAKGAPPYAFVENFPMKPLVAEADAGFLGFVPAPPTGNKDPAKPESVGGPVYPSPFDFNTQFLDDKTSSYIYQYTVALIRGLDYLAMRPEANVSNAVVVGYSWASTMVGLLHALDDRPAAYVVFHAPGYYVDEQGLSAGMPIVLDRSGVNPILLTRKQYEMYCPAAYAKYGTKPIYIGAALDDSYTRLDAVIEMYKGLQSPKAFAFAPNRHHAATSRNELNGYQWWISRWVFGGDQPPTVGEGTVQAKDGKLLYICKETSKAPLTHAELLVSYGKAGNWLGRTWHRLPMGSVTTAGEMVGEIPLYDASVPLYVICQIETEKFSAIANCPLYVEPAAFGFTKPTAEYPTQLFDPSLKDDLYIRVGAVQWDADGPDGKGSAIVSPGPEGTITFQNIDGDLWAGKKVLDIWLKGDGQVGPIRAYLVANPNYYLELGGKSNTEFDLVPTGATFAPGWKEYTIPLDKVANLGQVSSLFFDSSKRKLQFGPILVK